MGTKNNFRPDLITELFKPTAPTEAETVPAMNAMAAALEATAAAPAIVAPAPTKPSRPRAAAVRLAPPPPIDEPTKPIVPQRKLTAQVSEEVMFALYRHQADIRATPGSRAGTTTLGDVVDSLLRRGLGLQQLPE